MAVVLVRVASAWRIPLSLLSQATMALVSPTSWARSRTLRLARASLQRSWQMAGWQWWQSSVCFSRLGFAQICPRFFNMLFGRRVVSWLYKFCEQQDGVLSNQVLACRSILNKFGVIMRMGELMYIYIYRYCIDFLERRVWSFFSLLLLHWRMDWLAQLGETGASTLPLHCVQAGRSPRLLATSLERRPVTHPSTQQRSWVCRTQSGFGILLVWAQTRMRLPSSAVVPWRSSTVALSAS